MDLLKYYFNFVDRKYYLDFKNSIGEDYHYMLIKSTFTHFQLNSLLLLLIWEDIIKVEEEEHLFIIFSGKDKEAQITSNILINLRLKEKYG